MANFLAPPSTGVPAVQDRKVPPNTMDFTAVWRKWFIDLTEIINKSGGIAGGVPGTRKVSTEGPLGGGGDLTEDRELTFTPAGLNGDIQYNNAGQLGGLTGLNATVVLAKITVGGVNGSMTFVHGVLTAYAAPT